MQERQKEWFDNLVRNLKERVPDNLIVSHLEPDHSANIQIIYKKSIKKQNLF